MTVLHLGFFHFILPQNLVFPLFCIEDYYSHSASLLTCIKNIFLLFLLFFSPPSHFRWIPRYFTGLLLSPSSPLSASLTSLMESQGHDCCCCSYLSQAALQFLPHPLSMMISALLRPQVLRYWVTKGGDEIFYNNTAGLTTFWKVFRENSQVSPCHH